MYPSTPKGRIHRSTSRDAEERQSRSPLHLFNHAFPPDMDDLEMCVDIEKYISRNTAKAETPLTCAEKRKSSQEGPSDRRKQQRCEFKSGQSNNEVPAILPPHKKAKIRPDPNSCEVFVDESDIIAEGHPPQLHLPEDDCNTRTYDIPIPDMYRPSDEMAMTLLDDHLRMTRRKMDQPSFQIYEDEPAEDEEEEEEEEAEDDDEELDDYDEYEPWYEDDKENLMMPELEMETSQEIIINATTTNIDEDEGQQADALPQAFRHFGSPLRELRIPGPTDFSHS